MRVQAIQVIKQRAQSIASDLKGLPKDKLLDNFEHEMKKRQAHWTSKGKPITESEMIAGVTDEWKKSGWLCRGAGVNLEELIELGKKAIADPSGAYELPPMVQRIANMVGRNAPCPCGSGKKYKKCCGKGG